MLVKIDGNWIDPGKVEFIYELDPEETGDGGNCSYRGEPGFVRYNSATDGRPVLVRAGAVVALVADGGATEIETERGQVVLVKGKPDFVAATLNKIKHVSRVA
jgi:hypothetical protein